MNEPRRSVKSELQDGTVLLTCATCGVNPGVGVYGRGPAPCQLVIVAGLNGTGQLLFGWRLVCFSVSAFGGVSFV